MKRRQKACDYYFSWLVYALLSLVSVVFLPLQLKRRSLSHSLASFSAWCLLSLYFFGTFPPWGWKSFSPRPTNQHPVEVLSITKEAEDSCISFIIWVTINLVAINRTSDLLQDYLFSKNRNQICSFSPFPPAPSLSVEFEDWSPLSWP